MRHAPTGDGDVCPQDPAHGRMWFLPSRRQLCPHAKHTGNYLYAYDGVTPASQPAPDPVDGGMSTARLERTTTPELRLGL